MLKHSGRKSQESRPRGWTPTQEAFAFIERELRLGRLGDAQQALRSMTRARLKRSDLAEFARLCWRGKLATLGLLKLRPVFLARSGSQASELEKGVYAACLVQLGAVREGSALLASIRPERLARTHLFRAFAAMTRWEHAQAIPSLKRILNSRTLDEYDRLVARLNLAACWVQTGVVQPAEDLIQDLLRRFEGEGFGRVRLNLMALGAENAFRGNRFSEAERYLAVAKTTDLSRHPADRLQLKKIQWALLCARRGLDDTRLGELASIRREALRLGLWDTVRELDRYRAIYAQDRMILADLGKVDADIGAIAALGLIPWPKLPGLTAASPPANPLPP